MIRLLISLVILIVAANVAIAHCKHKSHEIFYPSPHNEHINIDDLLPKEINRHPHHRRDSDKINTDNLDDEIRKILPDILSEKHHKGGRNIRQNDPVVHISVEYDDKGKIDVDKNDRVTPIHKIIKKDLPDWLDENHDLNWNDRNKNKWRDDRDYNVNKDWVIRDDHRNKKHKNDWEIKRDDSDIWKKEITDWNLKDTEHKVWENNRPYVNWDKNNNNNNNDGSDLLYKNKNNLNIMVPEIVYDRTGEKNGLVELNDNINDFIWNTTKSLGDNLHNLETDLLNVKVGFKPLLSLNTKDILRGDLNIDPITVKRNNDNHVHNRPGGYNGDHGSIWDQSDKYHKWPKRQPQIKWDNENSRGVIKDRVIKVHEDKRETDWRNKPEWRYSSADGENDDAVDDTNGDNGTI